MPSDHNTPADDPVRQNIRNIESLERAMSADVSLLGRMSHTISAVVGTVPFVAIQMLWVAAWMTWNAVSPSRLQFDPYRFAFLGMLLSLEAVWIATFVLITQNTMNRKADKRDHLNLQITLLAEQEMTAMLRMQRDIRDHLGLPSRSDQEATAGKLMEDTSVHELMDHVDRKLVPKE